MRGRLIGPYEARLLAYIFAGFVLSIGGLVSVGLLAP